MNPGVMYDHQLEDREYVHWLRTANHKSFDLCNHGKFANHVYFENSYVVVQIRLVIVSPTPYQIPSS
jgi:hypothetical protein